MEIQFDNKLPIYYQIITQIKKDVISGKLEAGEKLPSVRDLAESLKVNPNTVQRVYQELERESVTYTQRGMGSFITQDKDKIKALKTEMAKDEIVRFIEEMKSLGMSRDEIKSAVNDTLEEE